LKNNILVKLRHWLLPLVLLGGISAVCAETDACPDFVTRRGNKLYLNGREYRAIGVNVPNLHQSFLGTWHHDLQIYGSTAAAKAAMIRAVESAARSGFAFIRFFASPGYPSDIDKLYMKDRKAYWDGMDELFMLCRKNNIRVIPSLGCILGAAGFSNYFEEPARAIFDRGSRSRLALDEYIRDFVTRYKDSPTVLMWELQNETMLSADVPAVFQEEKMFEASVVKRWETSGTAGKLYRGGPRNDAFSYDEIIKLYREQCAFIHSLDPNHLVTSGDGETRPECTSRRETFPDFKFRADTPEERIGNNLRAQPPPLDVFSYHFYGKFASPGKTDDETSRWMRRIIRASLAEGRPVFIGEIGEIDGPKGAPEQKWLLHWIDEAENTEISLMALWVWHFPWQPELTMDENNIGPLIRRCREFNRRHAGK
jgi:hypothetical protein